MLTISQFTEFKEATIKGLEKKHFPNARQVVEELNVLNEKRKASQTKLDDNLSRQNTIAKSIGLGGCGDIHSATVEDASFRGVDALITIWSCVEWVTV